MCMLIRLTKSNKELLLPKVNLKNINELYPMLEAGSTSDKYKLSCGVEFDKATEN